jgi:hypothetical protein
MSWDWGDALPVSGLGCVSCLRGGDVAGPCSSGRSAASSIASKKQPTFVLGVKLLAEYKGNQKIGSYYPRPPLPSISAALTDPAALQRTRQCDFVGIFEVAADRQAARQSRDTYAKRRQATL